MQHKKEKGRDFLPGPWNVSVLYSAVALKAASRELARYKFELVGLQEVRWKRGEPYEQGTVISSMKRNSKSSAGNMIFLHQTIPSAVKGI